MVNTSEETGLDRRRLHGMMQAYKTTSLLRSGLELGVFDALADSPLDCGELARRLGADARALRILLNALAALGLLETVPAADYGQDADGEAFRLAAGTDRLLVSSSPAYFGGMVHVIASDWEWEALRRLTEAVRHGGTVLDVNAETPEYAYWEDFASYAAAIARPTADVMADTLDPWARDRKSLDVLDVACGHGVYGFTFAERHPQARVWGLDWPNVVEVAARHAEELKVADRTEFITGDMFEAPLGGPYDLVTITNVLHHFSEERATQLLSRAAGALKPGGRVAIVGFAHDDALPAEADPEPHLFSVLMLVWTSRGEVHSTSVYERMLARSGLSYLDMRTVPGLPFRVLIAERA